MVKPITKYAIEIYDHTQVPTILEKAIFEAINGRPGPVWLSIPLDIQSMNLSDNLVINKINKNKNDNKIDDGEIIKLDKLHTIKFP